MHTKLSCSDIHEFCSTQTPVAITCKQKMTGILRASPALGKVAMTQTAWEKDGDSLTGEVSASPGFIWTCAQHCASQPWLPRQMEQGACWRAVTLPAAQTSPECWQKNEQMLCILRGSWDATTSLGSAARHCTFYVTLQGRQQPPCMPPSTLESPL